MRRLCTIPTAAASSFSIGACGGQRWITSTSSSSSTGTTTTGADSKRKMKESPVSAAYGRGDQGVPWLESQTPTSKLLGVQTTMVSDESRRSQDTYGMKGGSPGLDAAERGIDPTSPQARSINVNQSEEQFAEEFLTEVRDHEKIEKELVAMDRANREKAAVAAGARSSYTAMTRVTDNIPTHHDNNLGDSNQRLKLKRVDSYTHEEQVQQFYRNCVKLVMLGITSVALLKTFPRLAAPLPFLYFCATMGRRGTGRHRVRRHHWWGLFTPTVIWGWWVWCFQVPDSIEPPESLLDYFCGPPTPLVDNLREKKFA